MTRLELDLSAPMNAASVRCENVQVDCGTQGLLVDCGYGILVDCCTHGILADLDPQDDTIVVISFQPGLLDLTCCEVRLDGMLSLQGLPVANGYLVAVLIGDVNRDGGVSSSDYASVLQRLGNVAAVCP